MREAPAKTDAVRCQRSEMRQGYCCRFCLLRLQRHDLCLLWRCDFAEAQEDLEIALAVLGHASYLPGSITALIT